MTSLSCYLIVRDAATTLGRALQSVRPHVDELVVLDTGSTDETLYIARQHADLVHEMTWPDSFAAARNAALDRCSGEWTMFLDADDDLANGAAIAPAIEQAGPETGMLMLRYVTGIASAGPTDEEFWRERVVRRGACRWVGRAHEVLLPVNQTHYQRITEPWVMHHGHGDSRSSMERNIRLLRLDLQDNPTETRTQFYLGRDLVLAGRIHEGRRMLQRYMKTATWPDEMYIAQSVIGFCYRTEGLYREAFDADIQLLYIYPLWPGAYFQLAEDCYYLKQWDRSIHFCEIGERLPKPETNLFVSYAQLTYDWMIYKVVALAQVGRVADAAALTERALAIRPTDPLHLANQAYFAGVTAVA